MTSGGRPSVLHLLAPAPYGGLETVVLQLAGAQAEAGATVHVAAVVEPSEEAHPFLEALHENGIAPHVLQVAGRAYRRERGAVRTLLGDLRVDVLHTHGYRPDVIDSPVARAAGVTTVTTVHGFTGSGLRALFYEWLQRRAFREFDAVLAVSEPLVHFLARSGVPAERVHLMRNAWRTKGEPSTRVEARTHLGIPIDLPRVLAMVGRVSREKGSDVAIRALAKPELADAHLVVVGDGRQVESCRALAAELGVGGRIIWAGRVSDASRLMAAFDAVCLPSRTEGTPMVLFEATARAVPVVASAVGGVPHVLGEGWNVVPAGDPERLAQALLRATCDPPARADAVARARSRITKEYDPGVWAGAHIDLYQRLLSPSRRPHGYGIDAIPGGRR